MEQEVRQRYFEAARHVAACSHLQTCRSEIMTVGKAMPLSMPSPDYVGAKYRGLAIIVGNPGIAHAGIHHTNDAHMFRLQERIAQGDQGAFEELMGFLPESMLHWPQMVNQDGRHRMAYDIEEVAYVEIVKCATRPLGSNLVSLLRGTNILQRCWETHTRRVLDLLQPTHIVALWTPIIPTLRHLGYEFPANSQIGHHSGARNLTLEQRYSTARAVFDSYYNRA